MRTALLSVVLGASLFGCVSTIGDGDEGGLIDTDDDGIPDSPAPDDVDPAAPAKVTATSDTPTLATELGTASMLTFNVGSENFTGPVTLAASVTDAGGLPLTGWTVALSTTTMDMANGATNPVVATLTIPSINAGFLAANVKLDVTSSLGMVSTTSAVTALNQVSVEVKENAANGNCILPPQEPVVVKLGTKVRIVNKFTADKIVIHSDNSNIIPHEGQGGAPSDDTAPNAAYEYTPTVTGNVTWYCHAPASGNNAQKPSFTIQ